MGSQLGVRVGDLDPAATQSGKDGASNGVRIDEVEHESPAERAGLREGDIVVQFDGERVRSARQFSRLVRETPDGRTVPIEIVRNGQRQALNVTPEARSFEWNFEIDGDQIRRDVERGLRGFRFDGPAFDFDGRSLFGRRGRLGVQVDALTPQLAAYFGATSGGVLVTSVTEDSAAAKAGMKAGDVITSINGTEVRDFGGLTSALARAEGEIEIGVLRDRKAIALKATLEPPRSRRSTRITA